MKTYEKIEIIHQDYFQPERIKTVLLVTLCSLAVGLIPIVYGINTSSEGDFVIPTEAALWK
jgi:hypothetical protein